MVITREDLLCVIAVEKILCFSVEIFYDIAWKVYGEDLQRRKIYIDEDYYLYEVKRRKKKEEYIIWTRTLCARMMRDRYNNHTSGELSQK